MEILKKSLNQNIMLYFIIIPLLAVGCKKDVTDTIDITAWKWELKAVTTGSDTYKPKNKDYLRNDAYILTFEADSTFTLSTSVNYAGGNYTIPKNGEISIYLYEETTEVATSDNDEKKLNENLLTVFSEVTTYQVLGKTLIFKGSKGEVEFKKE